MSKSFNARRVATVVHLPSVIDASVQRLVEYSVRNREAGLHGLAAHLDFAHQVEGVKQGLLEFLARCRAQGKVVAGYGAPAKATTLFNFCGIGPEDIAYTVDQNPYKQGRFIPGTGIPIYSPEKLYKPNLITS